MCRSTILPLLSACILIIWTAAACIQQPTPAPDPLAGLDPTLLSPMGHRYGAPNTRPATLLQTGHPPLALIFEQGGNIRIIDATSRAVITQATAPPHTIISIDAESGIMVGLKKTVRGPLPADHRYEIWWDTKR